MPLIHDASTRRAMRSRGFVDRLFRRDPSRRAATDEVVERPRATLVDANTRTFWSLGDAAPATLVEEPAAGRAGRPGRAAQLVELHQQGRVPAPSRRPRANPAFTEALFVELMRAHQYRRAFAMLAPECRAAWRSVEAFAAAQGTGPMRRLRGVRVVEVRHIGEWTDAVHGLTYEDVVELDVEYSVGSGTASTVLTRVVHLVPVDGRWCSLYYPS